MARRSRRLSRRQTVVGVLLGLALLGLIGLFVNGVVSAASNSSGYVRLVNQTFGTQANTVIADQQLVGKSVSSTLQTMAGMQRADLQQRLDLLVEVTSSQRQDAEQIADPQPSVQAGSRFAAIVAERAQGTSEIRTAVDGLLGMAPSPVVGAVGSSKHEAAGVQLSPSAATSLLDDAAARLARSDAAVGPLRAALLAAPGHVRLSPSRFIADGSILTPASIAQLVADLESSPSLLAVHQVELNSVSLLPSPLPSADGSSQIVVAPTTQLRVTAVLRNVGNVSETGIGVSATVQVVAGPGTSSSQHRSASLVPGGVVAVPLGPLRVRPGSTVQLVVTVAAPPGQADATGLTQSLTIVVAPATAPTGAG